MVFNTKKTSRIITKQFLIDLISLNFRIGSALMFSLGPTLGFILPEIEYCECEEIYDY